MEIFSVAEDHQIEELEEGKTFNIIWIYHWKMQYWEQRLKLKYRFNHNAMTAQELEQNLEQNQKFVLHVAALVK